MKTFKRITSILLVLVMLIGSLLMSLGTSAYSYKVYGVDISAWQGNVNFTKMKQAGVNFVIMRIGYSATGKDKYFETYYAGAKAAGLNVGVYFYQYATTVQASINNANACINWLKGKQLEYPVYIDMEDSSLTGLGKTANTNNAIAFCDTMAAAGYVTGLYGNQNWFSNYINKTAFTNKGYGVWEARWLNSGKDSSDLSSRCQVWQYTSSGVGSTYGVSSSRIDLDVSYYDYPTYSIQNNKGGHTGSDTPVTPPPVNPDPPTPPTPTTVKRGIYKVNTSKLNMRKGPGTDYAQFAYLLQDQECEVLKANDAGTWAYILYVPSHTYGWVYTSYLAYQRPFNYSVKFDYAGNGTNTTKTYADGANVPIPSAAMTADGKTLEGWTVKRASDGKILTSTGWAASGTATVLPGDTSFALNATNENADVGEDSFTFTAQWKTATTTVSTAKPHGYGWYWPEDEAYCYMGGYGKNTDNIVFRADLCLLPGNAAPQANFWTEAGGGVIINQNSVMVGAQTVPYNWGKLGWDNWHNVQINIQNGACAVFIDGVNVAYAATGAFDPYNDYQMFFSQTGTMAVDNVSLQDIGGNYLFNNDLENEASANALFHADGQGLGRWMLLDIGEEVADNEVGGTPAYNGWVWPENVAYSEVITGTHNKDLIMEFDLCMMKGSDGSPCKVAVLSPVNGYEPTILISSDGTAQVGTSTSTFAGWGSAEWGNWHRVKIAVNGTSGQIFVDNKLICSGNNVNLYGDDRIYLFNHQGVAAIDNFKAYSSKGTEYFNVDFENDSAANAHFQASGYFQRSLMNANTVMFNMNGGTGHINRQIKVRGKNLTLSATVPERSGFTFKGWATTPTATAAQYQPGGTYTAEDTVTLYAVWNDNSHTHTFGEWQISAAADCTNPGTKTRMCSCGVTETETIPALGHQNETIPAVAATCTKAGSTEGVKCSRCQATLTSPKTVAALGHQNETIPAVAATCTKAGSTEGIKCSRCQTTLTSPKTVAALGHNYVNGECTRCHAKDPTYNPGTYTPGDLDNDGKFTAKDMLFLKQIYLGVAGKIPAADVDGDGKVTISDVNLLKVWLVGAK